MAAAAEWSCSLVGAGAPVVASASAKCLFAPTPAHWQLLEKTIIRAIIIANRLVCERAHGQEFAQKAPLKCSGDGDGSGQVGAQDGGEIPSVAAEAAAADGWISRSVGRKARWRLPNWQRILFYFIFYLAGALCERACLSLARSLAPS